MPDLVHATATGWHVTYDPDTREGTAILGDRRIVAPFTVAGHGTVVFRPDDEVPLYASLEVQRWIGEREGGGHGTREQPRRAGEEDV